MNEHRLLNKSEMLPGAAAEAGSSKTKHTGSWRTYAPVVDLESCTHCLKCWIFCPDSAVIVQEGRHAGTDYRYCKGCGICAEECPAGCIEMVLESERPDRESGQETREGENG